MKIFLLTLFILSCDTSQSPLVTMRNVCLIKRNSVLVEKRNFDLEGRIASVITYNDDGKTPIDSVSLESYPEIKPYIYEKGRYLPDDLLLTVDYYSRVYSVDTTCTPLKMIHHRYLIEDIVSNICFIHNSVLVGGQEVSSKAEVSKDSGVTTIRYPQLNSKFNDLPEVLESFFYDQTLHSFSFSVKEGHLKEESYVFAEGSAVRHFFYEKDTIKETILEIQNNEGTPLKIARTYQIKFAN